MSEDLELQNKIAELAGRINRHKTVQNLRPHSPSKDSLHDYGPGVSQWAPQRGTPYGTHRGSGRDSRMVSHRNRSLVVNSPLLKPQNENTPPTDTTMAARGTSEEPPAVGWVSKRDRHMQLINKSVYDQKVLERQQAMEESRKQKEYRRDTLEKAKINNHLQAISRRQYANNSTFTTAPTPQLVIHGVRFVVVDGGSKLIKARDEANSLKETPKSANVGGVTFLRSKHGNYYRAGLVRAQRNHAGIKKISQPCPQFSNNGTCPKGPLCRYEHDPEKVAICRDFLLTGKCQSGINCDLSHECTPTRVPACLHFLRGNCINPECRYAHVRTNPGAPVCRAFATLGFCPRGAECAERHIHECPEYANKGVCRNKKCRLPHVDRAGQLRKTAVLQNTNDEDFSSDISSDEELSDSDDVDSDDFEEEEVFHHSSGNHELSQQMDFVKF